jgi:hypothetical protein
VDAAITRGETVDALTLVRLSGAITRTVALLEKLSSKSTKADAPTLAEYLASKGNGHNGHSRSVDHDGGD